MNPSPNPDILKAAQILLVYEQLKQVANNQMNGFGVFNPVPFPCMNPIPRLPLAPAFDFKQKHKQVKLNNKNDFSIASLTSSSKNSTSSTPPSTPSSTVSSTSSSKILSTPSNFPCTLSTSPPSRLPVTPDSPWDNTAFESQLSKSNCSISSSNFHRPVRCVVNEQTAKPLEDWMISHLSYPYPTREDVDKLMKETGFDNTQVRGWFTNHRRRIAAEYEKRGEKLPWEKKQGPVRSLRHSPY